MVGLAALSIGEAGARLDQIAAAAGMTPAKDDLLALHDVLLGATADTESAPLALLATAVGLAAAADRSVVELLPVRPRVLLRLLRSGAIEAAWLVAVDSATGLVARRFSGSTSSGADRTEWPLPLLTCVEPPHVYADMPGFRDPRWGAPEAAYEIGDAVKLRCHVDEVRPGARPVLAGWAALDVLVTAPDEAVSVIAVGGERQIRWSAVRHRRADLVGGSREALRRRAWAGWSAQIEPSALSAENGEWELWLELVHRGLVRRVRLGRSVGDLAARMVGARLSERPALALVGSPGAWSLQRFK